ncbi:hypothetical protein Ddye_004802 [Dipteronia dyeriana]|uniref:Reverse transcriptase domain-containing protein n=1 Tax=Dipteronia dyeriana TaxID=168575 RepID=A0AAE0CP52_9ROSI|nr:hypothetical protein Ddye_004802 [Dipteronia dyeriana]
MVVKDLNRTFIGLIPIVNNVESMKDFKPISLVNSMYKILAKVLANRLRKVLSLVIRESQTAFVKNRQIIDIFMIADEIIHKWKKESEGGLVVKLDFEKAYDSVDHRFLDSVMEGIGFRFTNDTIIFLKPMMDFLLNAKRVLHCFELVSRYGLWGLEGWFNAAVNDWLYGWMGFCPLIKTEMVWGSLFSAIIWTIWEARNRLIFEDLCIETSKVKLKKIVDGSLLWVPPLSSIYGWLYERQNRACWKRGC